MKFARFNLVWTVVLASILAFCALLNYFVDPYSVFGSTRVQGLNAQKAKASSYTPLVKAYQIERTSPQTVLFGTSRVDIGLDPSHSAWPQGSRPVYNYALPEASILTMNQQLQHALQAGPVRSLVVGLEFQDFLRGQIDSTREPDEVEQRFLSLAHARSDWRRLRQTALDSAAATLTLSGLLDTIGTLATQNSTVAGDVSDSGLTSESPYAGLVRKDGHYDLFLQKDMGIVRARQQAARVLSKGLEREFVELAYLRQLIDFCQLNGIDLHLFIPPYHAHYLEIVDATGLWGRFENWKRELASLVGDYQKRQQARLTLWDFASYDEFTTEAVPAKGDRKTSMQWFWEPVHFKKALGDIIVARMLGTDHREFGVELTTDSLEDRLGAGRRGQLAYRQRLPKEAADIAALVLATK